jgi:hypothetical protein
MWTRESGLDRSRPLDAHVEELVVFAEAKREVLAALRGECEIDIFCGVFSRDAEGGFTIGPTLSARLAELQLAVAVAVY